MKVKTLQIRVSNDTKEYDLDDYLKTEKYKIENTFATLQIDSQGAFWEVLVFYSFNNPTNEFIGSKEELYKDLKEWTEKKATQLGISIESVEMVSKVFLFAKDFKEYNDMSDFLLTRNYGKKKFQEFGIEILEIFRKYQ
jgi:hypothetical protein